MVASAAGSEAKDAVSPLIAPVAETSGSSALGHDAQLAGEAAAVDTHAIAATRTKLLIERVKTRGPGGGPQRVPNRCSSSRMQRSRSAPILKAPSPRPMPPRSDSALSMVAQPQQVGRTQPLHPKLKRRAATPRKQRVAPADSSWSQPRRRRGRDKASAEPKPSASAGATSSAGLRIHGARKPCFASQDREMQRLARSKEQQPPAQSSAPKHIVHTALLSPNIVAQRRKPPLSERGVGAPRVVRGRFQPLRSLVREPPPISTEPQMEKLLAEVVAEDAKLGLVGSPPPVGWAEKRKVAPVTPAPISGVAVAQTPTMRIATAT